jgi:hypothetical protein
MVSNRYLAVALLPLLFAVLQTPEKPEEKKPPAPLKLAPRAYFVAHCQRCHGVDGTNYAPQFAKDKPLDKLKFDIERMARGPGGLPLKPEDVEVQIAYHQLISAAKPFLSWTAQEGLTLSGEFTEGAKLTANLGELKIDEDESTWTLKLPMESDFKKLKLTATLEKEKTDLVPSESSFAKLPKKESEPLAPPGRGAGVTAANFKSPDRPSLCDSQRSLTELCVYPDESPTSLKVRLWAEAEGERVTITKT